ncbi:uncharacterized protein BT62DRAFT_273403 [Guyanagaster necrorhizus]|uniref:Uncharacterized protein n=1 Tax=Guyanagaster necrorhizus TaxID=856835 RepID=A0A9P8AY05_9AGAR|nr:uncharacterized protein BT62DRAFT_273403 [Guyanagaster necrorhizus MCA 3950]KAG7451955.1 hypothetical protein BT62DRAFT_273403 [Guyanagaster necrorhizus MCA 3950]
MHSTYQQKANTLSKFSTGFYSVGHRTKQRQHSDADHRGRDISCKTALEALDLSQGQRSANLGRFSCLTATANGRSLLGPLSPSDVGLPHVQCEDSKSRVSQGYLADAKPPRESEMLMIFNAARVRNVPTFVGDGVLPGQITTSHKYINEDWNLGSISINHLYSRAPAGEVHFKSSRQLTRVVWPTKTLIPTAIFFTMISTAGTF